ncbi:AraC family ligand binding domain-containing protein [Brachybacterium sp. GU-2]|uniref:AraC family ligand binding domain-containing protein n=1 Tax=Brachybacterium sp. GU-2 TaxID=3069708 RepID=UPI00298CC450|nr:AraC family ligand binding domain-containing protein [Brachybacterium sp. GU-2]WNN96492.1 AraC family ligand binding domain-containing protein [Brachybacterium sp. GU-2]
MDTLVHVVRGEGVLTTEDGEELLRAGDVALLPRRTVRGFRAGEDGLEYLTVHRRRRSLTIQGPRD